MKSQDNNGCFSSLMQIGSSLRAERSNPFHLFFRIASDSVLAMTVLHKILYLLPFTFYLLPLPGFSQNAPISLTYEATMLGYGTSSVYDSYLSPLKYTGENVGLYYEQMKNTGLMHGNVAVQHIFNADYSWTKNNSGTASYYTGIIEYNYGLFYRFKPTEKWQFFAGPQIGGLLGFVYNTRNENNPATGKAHVNLSLSGIANYQLKIRSLPVHFRDQVSLPFIGAMYSPQYGESYYEISLGDTERLVHPALFHNYFSVSNLLMAEIPFDRFTLLLSYRFSFYETRINHLDTQLITNTFSVGLSHNFFVVTGKQKKDNYRYVFE